MGLLDRLRGRGGDDGEDTPPPEPPVDVEARRAQLDALERALRVLARSMADDDALLRNPGWSGRVDDFRFVANEAGRLSAGEFTRADLLDLAHQVVPLYRAGTTPPEQYAAYADEQAAVLEAVEALRAPLASEQAGA